MDEKHSTKDIGLAAAFISLGAKYSHADKTDPRHMIFFFESVGVNLDEVETQWVNGTLKGNLVAYKNAFQQMKSIVHSV